MKLIETNLFKISLTLILIFATLPNLYSQDYEKDKQEIRKCYYDMSEALINKNWEEYQNYWFQDTTINVLHPAQRHWDKGWHAVQKTYKSIFESDFNLDNIRMPKADIFDVHIATGGEFAWALIEQKLFSGDVKIRQSWSIVVYRKIDGKWLINSILQADLPSEN
jgi:ketosteroid isomerase-like protein